jgi:hypothetical protein
MGLSGLATEVHLDSQRIVYCTMTQQFHAVSFSFYEASVYQCLLIDDRAFFETPQVSDIDNSILFFKNIRKSPFWQTALKGHLPPLVTWSNISARAALLPFMAPPSGLSSPRTRSPAQTPG